MKAQDLKNSVLQLAIQEKLVEQNPNDEPVFILLDKIKAEKEQLIKDKKISKKKELPNINREEKNFDLPDTWEWVDLSNISIIQERAGIRSFQYREEGIQLFTVTNILENDIDLIKSRKYVLREEYIEKYRHLTLNKGDIVTACSGGSWGKTAVYDKDDIVMLNTSTPRMRFYGDLGGNKYLYYITKSLFFKEQLRKQLSGMQPNFGYLHYSRILIPIPPVEEQKRIVAKIEEVLEKIEEYDKAEKELTRLEKAFPQDMKKSILQYAVQGNLVEQNLSDEPASVLLEKIKAEKEQLIKEKKIKKEKSLPEISEEEKLFEIPKSWEWTRLGDVFSITMGQSPNGDTVSIREEGIEFHQGKVFFSDKYILKSDKYTIKPTKLAEKDTVLLSVRAPVGVVNITDRESCIGRGLCSIKSMCNMASRFAYLFLKAFESELIKKATGTTFVDVTSEVVKNQVIPLPPLEEQIRIVDKIEKILNNVDRLQNIFDNQKFINKMVQAKSIEVSESKELINN